MKKVAVIEDDTDLLALLKYNLERESFRVVTASRGGGALEICLRERPDLVLLDIMLPECDGLEICRLLRRQPQLADIPIIFLTARVSEADRIIGLEAGANDYIVKPFFMGEVLARIRVQLRPRSESAAPLKMAGIELDPVTCRARRNDRELDLTATEFRLLEFLMSRPGVVFTRNQLLDSVWGYDRVVSERAVDVYILRLRQKIEADPTDPRLIRSVRGFGYSFQTEAPVAAAGRP
jgi:two-component system phosphate regulon response regulator PhoB